jgi:hypothetical protein
MATTHCFNYSFLGNRCRVEIHSEHPEAAAKLQQYDRLFPAFVRTDPALAELTVSVHDIATAGAGAPRAGDIKRLRDYLEREYAGIRADVLDRVCSERFLGSRRAQALLDAVLADTGNQGISVQQDFLVFSNRSAGRLEAFADVAASLQEAWAFHLLNFFKVFFFAADTIRLHGSGATHGEHALLLLANTGGGKSTMKNFFLTAVTEPEPFTDDSIMVRRTETGFALYQDPVEFLRWCYMPEDQLADQVIPQVREPIHAAPALYYLVKAATTAWRAAEPAEILELIKAEAFYQRGFLTQRFVPAPRNDTLLKRYFENTLSFLATARCQVAGIRHNDDYAALFAEFKAQLGVG